MISKFIFLLILNHSINFDGLVPSQWIDPYGRQPKTHQQWLTEIDRSLLSNFSVGTAQAEKEANTQNLVAVIVNAKVYPDLVNELNQFRQDLLNCGYEVRIDTARGLSAQGLRSYLAGISGLVGAILIGEMPVEWYEINGWGAWEEFPIDLYFTDLNGTWIDNDLDSIYDNHSGNVAPEIWLGRIYARNLTWDSEIRLYKRYFQKNHLYRTHQLSLPQRGLSYVDDDWYGWGACYLNLVYPNTVVIENQYQTTAQGYRDQLRQGYEWIHLCAHSSPWGHTFKYPTSQYRGTVFNYEIFTLEPRAHFFNLFACSGTRFVEENYSAGWYIFHDSCGLLAIGSAKTGGMLDFDDFYTPLSQGQSIGNAFKSWFIINGESSRAWFYGLNIIGDPTLKPKEQAERFVSNSQWGFIPTLAEVVAPDSESDGFPAVVSEPSGRIWTCWESGRSVTNGRCDIYSAYRTTGWSGGIEVGPFIYWDYNPTIGLDSLDRPLAVWAGWENIGGNYQYDLFYSYWNGSNWSGRTMVHPLDPTSDMKPSLARDRNNRPWVAWQTKRDVNSNIYVSYYSGSNWSPPRAVNRNPSEEVLPKIICDNTGRLWVFYNRRLSDRAEIWGSWFDGSNWIETGPISANQRMAYNPAASITQTGKIWVTWQSYDNGNGEIYGSYYTGTGWSNPINISNHPLNDLSPNMATDASGYAWVVWSTNRDGNWNIYYSYCRDLTWSTPEPVDLNTGIDLNPSIASGPASKIWILWQNYSNNNWEIYALAKDAIGIEEKEKAPSVADRGLEIWPNPTRSNLRLTLKNCKFNRSLLRVFDITGKLVKEITISNQPNQVVDLTGFAAGTYFFEIKQDSCYLIKKFTIIK